MFKNLLFKAVNKLNPEEKEKLRESLENDLKEKVVDENESEDKGESQELGKEQEDMAENKDLEKDKKSKETENTENPSNKTDEKPKDSEADGEKLVDGEKPEENLENQDENGENPNGDAPQEIVDTEPVGNGVRLEDLVTKSELAERLAAIEAKYDAVVKENQDLKDKYENKDFGGYQKKGMIEKDKQANSSFDEYSKEFM